MKERRALQDAGVSVLKLEGSTTLARIRCLSAATQAAVHSVGTGTCTCTCTCTGSGSGSGPDPEVLLVLQLLLLVKNPRKDWRLTGSGQCLSTSLLPSSIEVKQVGYGFYLGLKTRDRYS